MVVDEPAIVQRRGSCRGAGGGGWDEWSGRARVFGHLSVVPTCIVAGYNPTVPRECTSFMIQRKKKNIPQKTTTSRGEEFPYAEANDISGLLTECEKYKRAWKDERFRWSRSHKRWLTLCFPWLSAT